MARDVRGVLAAGLAVVLGCTASPPPEALRGHGTSAQTLFDDHTEVVAHCHPATLDAFRKHLGALTGQLPLWRPGEVMFVSWDESVAVAGSFNGWSKTALHTESVCGTNLYVARMRISCLA
jgi:hypothetical protein